MRILHTADWHLGQTLKGFTREHEHREVLEQLVAIVRDRDIDAVLVAGDVFDHPIPSGQSQLMFYETLVRLNAARPGIQIVVTAGNHDNAGRLEAPRPLLSSLNVHIVGNVRRPGGVLDASHHLVTLKDRNGKAAADILAVSHPTASCLPVLPRAMGEAAPIAKSVEALYQELYEAVRPRLTGAPLIVMGHLHVAGAIESEGAERRILAGGQHAVAPSVFPASAAYVALGHLHKPQTCGSDTVRYSGSLLPLSASEHDYNHGVAVLTLADGKITTEHVALKRPVAFVRLPAKGTVRLEELAEQFTALNLDAKLPLERQPFVHIHLARDGLSADYRAEAERIAQAHAVRVVDISLAAMPSAGAPTAVPFVRLVDRAPDDLFRAAFERVHGQPPQQAHLDVFHRIAAEA
jgi:DNA repair protein SbcD/Mre11